MRHIIALIAASLLAACAGSPPKPPEPSGSYRPINKLDVDQSQMVYGAKPTKKGNAK